MKTEILIITFNIGIDSICSKEDGIIFNFLKFTLDKYFEWLHKYF